MYGPPSATACTLATCGADANAATGVAAMAREPAATTVPMSARLYAPLGAHLDVMGADYVEQGKCGR